MTSDDVTAFGRTIPARVSGYVDRVVQLRGASVREVFVFNPVDVWEPGLALRGWFAEEGARLVDTYRFDDESGWAPALLYRRFIPGSDAPFFDAAAFFAGNREADKDPRPERDLRDVAPMPEGEFWALIASLGGHASVDRVVALEEALAERDVVEIEAFWRRLMLVMRALLKEPIAEAAREQVTYGSDPFEWWCLAVIAQGPETVAAVRKGGSTVVSEDEWEAGGLLLEVAQNAEERREGVRPEYVMTARRRSGARALSTAAQAEAFLREKYGDGTVDREPGPRTPVEMEARGLLPSVVTSRFLVRTAQGCHECLVAQHIDVHGENVDRYLREGAQWCAGRLGGVLATRIEHMNTHSLELPPSPFEIRRGWKGGIDGYLARHHSGVTQGAGVPGGA